MNIEFASTLVKWLCAVSATTVVGSGTMIVTGASTNAAQDARITGVIQNQVNLSDAVNDLREIVQQLDKNVAVLNERLRRERDNVR